MAEFQIITDYSVNKPWILTDATLTDMAVGKLASLGSDQGNQLRAQTQVLQEQVAAIESLRDLMPKFSESAFIPMSVNVATSTLKIGASWDISDLANTFPNGNLPPNTSDATIQRLIDFYIGINQMHTDVGSTNFVGTTNYRITYKTSPSDLTMKVVVSSTPPQFDPFAQQYYIEINQQRQYIVLVKTEGFAVPLNANQYQTWLSQVALARDSAVSQLFTKYQLTPVTGDTIQWQVVTANGSGSLFFGNLPVATTNVFQETEVGKIVQSGDGKYYRIKTPFVFGVTFATFDEIKPVTPLNKPLLFAPSTDTLRDIRGKFSEAALQVTQRNASQQLLVNSLLVSYNYHFDAAANVLKAFSDLRSRVAGNV